MLKNVHLRDKSNKNAFEKYRKQRNFVTALRRQAIKSYFMRHCNQSTSPADFWKTIKPFMSNQELSRGNIILRENDEIISNESEIAEIFNNFFISIADNIGISDEIDTSNEMFLQKILERHDQHPSIKAIKCRNHNCHSNSEFSFVALSQEDAMKYLSNIFYLTYINYDQS